MIKHILALVLGITVFACGQDPAGPSIRDVEGTYTATTLLVTENVVQTDYLARGALIELRLHQSLAMVEIFIPREDGSLLMAPGLGTWTLEGDRVLIQPAAEAALPPPSDPNLPPIPPAPAELAGDTVVLVYENGHLSGELMIGQAQADLVLRRQ